MSRYTYGGESERVSDPGDDGFAVVPSDDDALPSLPKYLYVGVGGDVAVKGPGEGALPLLHKNVPSGSYLAFRAKYVMDTGTTATNILAIL